MGKDPKKQCKATSHQHLKARAKNRVEDLQSVFTDLQYARKESRPGDVALLEEQVNQILHDWKAELNEPTPASSLIENSFGSLSDLGRLLEQLEELDDATSAMPESTELMSLNQGLEGRASHAGESTVVKEEDVLKYAPPRDESQGYEQFHNVAADLHNTTTNVAASEFSHSVLHNNAEIAVQLDYGQIDQHPGLENEVFFCTDNMEQVGMDWFSDISGMIPDIHPPPSAYLGPKCALWDCPRPVQGSERCRDYCSEFHATLAASEGPPGMAPVLRPKGIGLKDGSLFSALRAKMEGKDVGIPECVGAASARSPWNAPDLFDTSFIEGETVREWLFFDKPRRAFECGNRKQRSLPDYNGRGWHESRKLVMKEFDGWKRSYYMDPQPLPNYEWHLFEYEIENCEGCALYRLELKLTDGKKSSKAKVTKDSLVDLQKRMGRLTADTPENKRSGKGKGNGNVKPETVDANPNTASATSEVPACDGSMIPPESHSNGDTSEGAGKL